jgi:ribosomal protein S18 acetylase RimI-like enzyme
MEVEIRSYRDSDYESLKKVLVDAGLYSEIWDSKKNLKKKISVLPGSVIVAIKDGDVVGCIYAQTDGWEGFLWRLGVSSAHRRQGIGAQLINSAEKFLVSQGVGEFGMFVNAKKTDLHSYYKKLGYETSGNEMFFFRKKATT